MGRRRGGQGCRRHGRVLRRGRRPPAPGAPIAEGRPAIAAAWGGFYKLANFELAFAPTRITIAQSGDVAFEVGTYSLAFDGDQGRVQDKGKYVVAWKKAGGAWKAAADIFNSNGAAQ